MASLKIYGRRVGIEEKKLNFMALRRTAMRWKLDEGADSAGMQVWLDSREETRFTRYRLKHLPGREEELTYPQPLPKGRGDKVPSQRSDAGQALQGRDLGIGNPGMGLTPPVEEPPSQPPPNSTERNSGEEKDGQPAADANTLENHSGTCSPNSGRGESVDGQARQSWTGLSELDQPLRKIDEDSPLTLTHPPKPHAPKNVAVQAVGCKLSPSGRGNSLARGSSTGSSRERDLGIGNPGMGLTPPVEEPLRERPPSQPPPNSITLEDNSGARERNSGEEKDDQSQGGRSNDLEAGSTLTLLPSGKAPDACSPFQGEGKNSEVPVRKAKPFREGEGVTHGMYRRRVDREMVKAVMRENITGVDDEMRCMQELMQGMLEVDEDAERLMEAYSQAMRRMQVMVQHKESPKNREAEEWVKSTREQFVNAGVEIGIIPESEKERMKEVRLDGTDTSREMVAAMRLMLRNIYKRAMEGVDGGEFLRLVDLYGAGCVRLSRVLRAGGDEYVRIRQRMWDEMDEAIRQVGIEMGIGEER